MSSLPRLLTTQRETGVSNPSSSALVVHEPEIKVNSGTPTISTKGRRRSSLLKRTTTAPASAFNAVIKTTQKGARTLATVPAKRVFKSTKPSSQKMSPPPPVLGGRVTTIFAAFSIYSGAGDEYLGSPSYASMMVLCSRVGEPNGPYFPPAMGSNSDRASRVTAMGVVEQKRPWWSVLFMWWSVGGASGRRGSRVESGDGGYRKIEEVAPGKESPFLAVFQIVAIMLLTAMLTRNLEIFFGAWTDLRPHHDLLVAYQSKKRPLEIFGGSEDDLVLANTRVYDFADSHTSFRWRSEKFDPRSLTRH
ncbi:hypothetical protein P691DRAFT_783027 [Macrolepiota fuliginosa MF-IS2]|uniref:Uncharacterized protein n=1 Tax=Macrolepiota fuliginosa MF-IS2 TaxID=1400762 RepID=A0A9P5X9K0_9AGAR|nr:hypothetical protein P691DRAFT_783027 [Macrolepiota fuliginosa MF-IS2]